MNEYIYDIGTSGKVKIQDNTDSGSKNVVVWLQGPSISIPSIPWSWVLYDSDGNAVQSSNLLSFRLLANNNWQLVSYIYVGTNARFLLGIGATDTDEMGRTGETFSIPLMGNPDISLVSIKVGDQYKKAIPFINDNGVWKPVQVMVMSAGEWKRTT